MAKKSYKPTALRALEGGRSNSLSKPEDINEPRPMPVTPECPFDIDAQAKKVWGRLAPKLERLGLLTEADGDMFAALCQLRSRLYFIHNKLKSKNHKNLIQLKHTVDGAGNEFLEAKPNAYVVMEKQYYQIFRTYAGEFGLSPRGRIGLSIGKSEDGEGEDLLSK